MANINKPCVYFFPLYVAGHLIPMMETAKSLLQCNPSTFSIHFLLWQPKELEKESPISFSYLQSFQAQNLPIHIHQLPYVEPPHNFDGIEEFVTLQIRSYLPHVRAALLASHSPISALIVDLFATDLIDVAKGLNIPPYIYLCSNTPFLSLSLYLSCPNSLYDQVDFSEEEEEIHVPGLTPIPSISIPNSFVDMKSSSAKTMAYHTLRHLEVEGVIINSNIHIETKAMKALANSTVSQLTSSRMFPEIYPIGPVILSDQSNVQKHKSFEWLDKQPAKSVVFLCFGSMIALEVSQVQELAAGLEQSGLRFLWVLLMPSRDNTRRPTDANAEGILPERTKGRGMVWPSWAPQTDLLSHEAIGGFVTHCGWNSILQSIWFGVPMIAWPLYAGQHLNAFHLVKEMQVAVELAVDRKNKGFVSARELARAMEQLIDAEFEEGRRARSRVEVVKWNVDTSRFNIDTYSGCQTSIDTSRFSIDTSSLVLIPPGLVLTLSELVLTLAQLVLIL